MSDDKPNEYVPRTEFGKHMMELRKRIVESVEPLLSLDEIDAEIRRSRGEGDE